MNRVTLVSVLTLSCIGTASLTIESAKKNAEISIMGLVYCDTCSSNSLSKYNYNIPGALVKIDCEFKAAWPGTREQMQFSVNRTTNRFGVYKMGLLSVEGLECSVADIASLCQATLLLSSSDSCNVPGYSSTTNLIVSRSKRSNTCIYSFSALSFRPSKRNTTLCGE